LLSNNSIIKNSIKDRWLKPSQGKQKGKAKKKPKDTWLLRTKKRGRVNPSCGRKLFDP
jgi:hypothetical protein